jgi:site-specific recombinase XerD
MDIQTALRKTIISASASLSQNTVRAYTGGLANFVKMLAEIGIDAEQPISALEVEHFIEFPGWLLGRYSKRTAFVYASAGKFFLDWLVIAGELLPNYQQALRFTLAFKQINKKREAKMPRFPAREDVKAMRKAVREMEWSGYVRMRNIALVDFLASTGCRVSEIVPLFIRDLQDEMHSIIVTGKGNKERRVYIAETARRSLKDYWRDRNNEDPGSPLFMRHDKGVAFGKKVKSITPTTIRNVVTQIAGHAGIEKFSPHYFRHAFAIRVLSETGNLALTQDLLGHASPASTRVYAKIYPEDIKQAHKEIFG